MNNTTNHTQSQEWEWEIGPRPVLSFAAFRSIYQYRHLLGALVRKDFLLNYQQTILGPLWIFFQPLLTLVIYVLVFGKMIGIPTGKTMPPVLFYFSGIILWNFFSDAFWGISNNFRDHLHMYSKVYFPRLVVPLSILGTNFFRFMIQFALFVMLLVFFILFQDFSFGGGWHLLYLPLVFLGIAFIGMGGGLVTALLTAKYRDIANLTAIVLRLLMFVTPVLYPLGSIPDNFKWIVLINPLTPLFELFRFSVLGEGTINSATLLYSFGFGLLVLVVSVLSFNARSSKLIDIA